MQAAANFAKSLFRAVGNFIAPPTCIVCDASGPRICVNCMRELVSSGPHSSSWITSAFAYKSKPMRAAIRHLKTLPDKELIRLLVSSLTDRLMEELSERQTFGFPARLVLIPIPLSHTRFIERGYNQAHLIAKELSKNFSGATIDTHVLKRSSKYTKQALVTDRAARFKNQSGSMVAKSADPNTGYIIIDDVSTSGATLAEAKRALAKAGAKHVIAAVMAH
jgi:ComF family protein